MPDYATALAQLAVSKDSVGWLCTIIQPARNMKDSVRQPAALKSDLGEGNYKEPALQLTWSDAQNYTG